jgi:ATP/maltotriose-dependent transcriptional regulator MalT/DNA-binding SARP family transcriptional activator
MDNRGLECLWYQVDQGETDIATFFYYMRQMVIKDDVTDSSVLPIPNYSENVLSYTRRYIQGLLQRFPILSAHSNDYIPGRNQKRTKTLPKYSPDYLADLSVFTQNYFRQLFSYMQIPFAIVFDGYDELPTHSEFHNVICDGLSEIPQNGCVIFISRSDPPATMARFRANQTMQFVSWEDLRLTRDESDGIVKMRGLEINNETMQRLYEKNQGWAAGLVLMLEHYRTEGTMSEPPDKFTPQIIFDYLAGEIFYRFDTKMQDFLIRTACLPQMTVDMAEGLSGNDKASLLLEELKQHHYFVTARKTPSRQVYQYHPLFREFLLTMNKEALSENESKNNQNKAAMLLESNGHLDDAVSLLIDTEDWDQLAELIQKHAADMRENGRSETLVQWLEVLPKESVQKNPWLVYWLGTCSFPLAFRESRRFFERAHTLFSNQQEPDINGLLLSCSGVMNAILFELDDLSLLDYWIDKLDILLKKYLDDVSNDIQAHVTTCMFMSMSLRQPANSEIEYWLDFASKASRSSSNPNLRMSVELFVAIAIMWAGHFQKAWEIIQSMQKLASIAEITPLNLTTLKNVESMYFMLQGKHEQCLKVMYEGLNLANSTGITIWNYQLLLNGVGGALGAGDVNTAEGLLNEIESQHEQGSRQEQCFFHYFSAWTAMLKGEKLQAFKHQKTALRLSIEVGNPFFEILCRLAMAQILFETGDHRKGAIHLRQVHDDAREIKNRLLEFSSFMQYAYIAVEHGRKSSGLNSLKFAMQSGREYGYTHTLWWQPEVMAKLCAVALHEGIETEYVRNLIQERDLILESPSVAVEQWPWMYKIFTFGQCQLLKDDHPMRFKVKLQRKPMDLLKALIAYGADDVDENILAESLWPGIDKNYSLRSLTTTIHRLRKLLGEDKTIIVHDGRISIDKRICWLDIWAFEHLVDELDALFNTTGNHVETSSIITLTDKVLSLYRGPFLANETEKPWYVSPREHLRNRFIRCMSGIANFWEKEKCWEKAIECYQRSLEADNLAEGSYQKLMLCYRELGRQAEAIEVYKRCRKTLSAVLKIEPSSETTMLYENLLHEL